MKLVGKWGDPHQRSPWNWWGCERTCCQASLSDRVLVWLFHSRESTVLGPEGWLRRAWESREWTFCGRVWGMHQESPLMIADTIISWVKKCRRKQPAIGELSSQESFQRLNGSTIAYNRSASLMNYRSEAPNFLPNARSTETHFTSSFLYIWESNFF